MLLLRASALAARAAPLARLIAPPSLAPAPVRCANSKAGGTSHNGRDSAPKYLGVKKFGGEWVEPGDIIVRQRGARFGIVASTGTVALGRDHTLYSLVPGYVKFWHHAVRRKSYVEVVRSPPAPGSSGSGASAPPVEKYPIAHVRPWELPALDKLVRANGEARGAEEAAGSGAVHMTPQVAAALAAYRVRVATGASSGGAGPASYVGRQRAAAAAAAAAGGGMAAAGGEGAVATMARASTG